MNAKQYELQEEIHILDSRIGRLDLKEWDAISRCDWSAARNVVLERAPLKEVRQRTAAPKQEVRA
jgi:hypothetical protein